MSHLGATSGLTHLGTREECGQCPPLTEEKKGPGHFKVDVSFYVDKVDAPTAAEAEALVSRELNSKVNYWRELLGYADVHEGDTVEWDMEG
jgi:hypothetical protein